MGLVWFGWRLLVLALVGTGLGRNKMCVFIPYFMIVCFESWEGEEGVKKERIL